MRMAARWVIGVLIGLATLAGGTPPRALGAPGGSKATPSAASAADKDAQARDHYARGQVQYDLGNWDAAIAEFKQAYEISGEPALLFNVAQAYRLKEDFKQALYFYKTYLRRLPDAPNRADVEKRIGDMERALASSSAPAPVKDDAVAVPVETAPPTASPPTVTHDVAEPARPGRGKRIGGLVTAGTGLVLVAAGVYFGTQASSLEDELGQLGRDHGTWTPAQQDRYDEGERDATLANVSYVVGGVALVAGAALYYWGWRDERGAVQLSFAPSRHGAQAGLTWAF